MAQPVLGRTAGLHGRRSVLHGLQPSEKTWQRKEDAVNCVDTIEARCVLALRVMDSPLTH
jgi:hypothetical protein